MTRVLCAALLLPLSACSGGESSRGGSAGSAVTTVEPGQHKVCPYPDYLATFNDIWMRPGDDECDVAIEWTDIHYSVARSSVEDLAGQTVVTTKGATADIDLLARIAAAGLTDVKVEYVNDVVVGARRVAEGGPDALNSFIASRTSAYEGGPGSGLDCPN